MRKSALATVVIAWLSLLFGPPAHADGGATVPYPADPGRPVSAGVPGGIMVPSYEWSALGTPAAPVPAGPATVTPPTAPFMSALSQGPARWAMAGRNMVGFPPGWFGFGWGGTSVFGLGALDTGQGDTHPATVPYPARFP